MSLSLANGAIATIHVASHVGDLEKVKKFVEKGVIANVSGENGLIPLKTAAVGD
jgi:hypothetical protein